MKQCRPAVALLLYLCAAIVLFPSCRRSEPSPEPSRPHSPVKNITLTPGDTLGESLQDTGLAPAERGRIVSELGKVFNLRRCKAGDQYEVVIDSTSGWTQFRYYPGGLDFYSLHKSTDGTVETRKKARMARKTVEAAGGALRSTLWEAMSSQKIDPEIIVDFADIFAWQIDFLTEPREGDHFKILFEKYVLDNGKAVNRRILAAEYCTATSTYTAIVYTTADGRTEYFSADGRSLRSAFLRAPLQYRRISSFFTRRRYHPILKRFRPHLGIDYCAPSGTPVSSIGDGVVTFSGRKGGFGKFVSIRHVNGYASYYGHLSRYGSGIRRGTRVRQGQVIGYVGSTGLSTGPHLDFRCTLNSKFINFMSIKTPTAITISSSERDGFEAAKREMLSRFVRI